MSAYKQLQPEKIIETVATLEKRIAERFPASGLRKICGELLVVAQEATVRSERIGQPVRWLRCLAGLACILFVLLSLASLGLVLAQTNRAVRAGLQSASRLADPLDDQSMQQLIPTVEAELNVLVLLGGAIFFLLTIENRYKRRRALKATDELRSMAHIIDMHQLTKDPKRLGDPRIWMTASSPQIDMTCFELSRYLDYCSEMLSLLGKIAVLYAQQLDDAVALAAANEVESLTTGLSRKIWQKLLILHSWQPPQPQEGPRPLPGLLACAPPDGGQPP